MIMMRLLTLFFFMTTHFCYGQTNSEQYRRDILANKYIINADIKDEFVKNDISFLFTRTSHTRIFGFIGDNYQRIRIKFISVIKNEDNPSQYFIYGKSMVKENICEFQGYLTIKNVFNFKNSEYPETRTGKVIGEYIFFENPSQKHVGSFRGVFCSNWYFDKDGNLKYDDLMDGADGFSNNGFVGTWTNYLGTVTKICNWGDDRIPMSGDLDSGAGEFHPDQKYVNNGWLTIRQAYGGPNDKAAEEAVRKEKYEWWK
jgi:hypothetical protein